MEKTVNDAAMENDVETLRLLLQGDPLILDKETLNSQDKNPLHIAAAFGYVNFVQVILGVCPDMCLAGDRFGRIPLHLAIIKGRLEVLQELIRARPLSAREKIDGGGNALHLCIKHNQLGALKILVQVMKDDDFANAKNDDGMTILHLAICDKQFETISYLLQSKIVEVNAKNANGRTALDLLHGETNVEIARSLKASGAKRSDEIEDENGLREEAKSSHSKRKEDGEWLYKKRDAIMVVASLIATMAFQAGVNPAGGVWQDDNPPHVAGEAVMAFKHPRYYRNFIRANTVAFVSSLSTILLLISGLPFKHKVFMWVLMVIMWLTITAIAITYGISIEIVTPRTLTKPLSNVIETAVTVWCGVMALMLLGNTVRLIDLALKHRGIDVLKKLRTLGGFSAHQENKSTDERARLEMC